MSPSGASSRSTITGAWSLGPEPLRAWGRRSRLILERAPLDPVQPESWERVERWLGAAKPSVSSIVTSRGDRRITSSSHRVTTHGQKEWGKDVVGSVRGHEDGNEETRDVILLPERVVTNWWRADGHRLVLDDLKDVREDLPEHLIVGTGAYGQMRPDPEALDQLEREGVKVEALATADAVRRYGELDPRRTAAALHLTC
jgi:hypothetical protein